MNTRSELYYSYVEELEKKFFKNRVAGTLQFGVSHEELTKTYIYAETYMKAVAEAASNQGYQLEEFWQDNMSKNVVFKFIYVGNSRSCANCVHFAGTWCPEIQMPTTEKAECSQWSNDENAFKWYETPKNKKGKVFCKHCKQEIEE